ncbi:acyl-CoA dehydrogenase family protein [Sphingobium sp.]|uniref:acyl-CoA dehydrogenase family protein n=1 Tax=Sphingobium sp. TaxID=1912891 RepID=UPI0028BDBE61|nr:acyl-CoA dehydrogenase family protein [Sphingobium sp.]
MATAPTLKSPDVSQILASARALVPELRAMSADINRARMVPESVIQRLQDAGLMGLTRSALYGGPELDMSLVFQIGQILAEGDGSTAWVYCVTNSHDHLVGLYPKAVQDTYWASPRPLCASSYQPQGKVTKVDGGYRLTGQWGFCSGIDHCDWVVVGSLIFGEGGPPRLGLFMLERSEYEIVDDWYMMGLSGTGSKTVKVEDMFVPDERMLDNADVMNGKTPGAAIHGNPLYRTSIWLLFGFSILAPTTGITRAAYNDTVAAMREKAASKDPIFAARIPAIQQRLAEISVKLDACELLYQSSLQESEALVMAGKSASDEIRTRNRRNQAFIAFTCREVLDSMMQMAGGRGLKDEATVQRALRDVYAISAHPGGNLDSAFASFGSVALGGPPTEMFC